jgi:hypothetical protein
MNDSMNIFLEKRRKNAANWLIDLPYGENDTKIQMAIANCFQEGKTRKQVVNFLLTAFSREIDEHIEWHDYLNIDCFTKI